MSSGNCFTFCHYQNNFWSSIRKLSRNTCSIAQSTRHRALTNKNNKTPFEFIYLFTLKLGGVKISLKTVLPPPPLICSWHISPHHLTLETIEIKSNMVATRKRERILCSSNIFRMEILIHWLLLFDIPRLGNWIAKNNFKKLLWQILYKKRRISL